MKKLAKLCSLRGYTIIELLVSSFIALMILSVVYMFFWVGRKSQDYSEFSFLLGRDAYTSIKWIMRDLRETSLTSIRSYEENPAKESPVLTFQSASMPGDNKFIIGAYGTPDWQKHVVYTLKPDQRSFDQLGIKVASLIRYELPGDGKLPPYPIALELPGSTDHPSLPNNLQYPRVILRNIVLKGQKLDESKINDHEYEGFKVSFVKRLSDKDELSDLNPALSEDIEGNTKLVNVEFTILQVSGTTGKQNILGLDFKVNPRN